jgi:uncharacterized protein YegL
MTDEVINAEIVELPEDEGGEPRCAVVLLLDTSGSMQGEPIAQLNAGLQQFRQALTDDDLAARRCEVAVVTFGGGVTVIQDFAVASALPALAPLQASGETPMGAAINRAIDMIASKKQQYRSEGRAQYRPWVFMVTDGQPTDDYSGALARVHQGEHSKSFMFFAVGCFNADMSTLRAIAPPNRPPAYLQGANFRAMFQWLSDSLGKVAGSTVGQQLALPPTTGWGGITT